MSLLREFHAFTAWDEHSTGAQSFSMCEQCESLTLAWQNAELVGRGAGGWDCRFPGCAGIGFAPMCWHGSPAADTPLHHAWKREVCASWVDKYQAGADPQARHSTNKNREPSFEVSHRREEEGGP